MLLPRIFSAFFIDIMPLTVVFLQSACKKMIPSRHYPLCAHFIICRITSVNINPFRAPAFADFLNIGA